MSPLRLLMTLDGARRTVRARSILIKDTDAGFLERHVQTDRRSHGHSSFARDRSQFCPQGASRRD